MKKIFTLLAALLIIATAACKKEKEETPAGNGSWTLNGKTYVPLFSSRQAVSGSSPSTLFVFTDVVPTGPASFVNTLNISFKTVPTTSGTYQLVGTGQANTDNKFEVAAGLSGVAYVYIGSAVNAEVMVTGGKIKVIIPEVTVKSSSSGQPDVKLSASISEL